MLYWLTSTTGLMTQNTLTATTTLHRLENVEREDHVCGVLHHDQVVVMHEDGLSIHSLEGKMVRSFDIDDEDYMSMIKVHPVLNLILLADHRSIFCVDWWSGEQSEWPSKSELFDFEPHDSLPLLFVKDSSGINLYDRQGTCHMRFFDHHRLYDRKNFSIYLYWDIGRQQLWSIRRNDTVEISDSSGKTICTLPIYNEEGYKSDFWCSTEQGLFGGLDDVIHRYTIQPEPLGVIRKPLTFRDW